MIDFILGFAFGAGLMFLISLAAISLNNDRWRRRTPRRYWPTSEVTSDLLP